MPPPKPRWYNYWPLWRRIMLSGAVILLIGALVPAIVGEDGVPTWLGNATLIIGYGLLAWGFFRAMASRRHGWTHPEAEDQEEEKS